jgi:hypothetical protein
MAQARPICMFRNPEFIARGAGPAFEDLRNPAGAWGACEHCAPWVERRDVTGLLNYVMLESITRTGKPFNLHSAQQLSKLWSELFQHLGAREEFVPIPEHAGR